MAEETSDESPTKEISLSVSKLKVPDLKKELKSRGLSTTGNKNELVERLQHALKSNKTANSSDSIDDIEEELLNDDDDEHIDERESLVSDLDNELDYLPKAAEKRKSESLEKVEGSSGPPKKVILKRNNSETLAIAATLKEEKNDVKTEDKNASNGKSDEKKVIKLSELSVKERLEMRAKKFGVTAVSVDAKKLARAERFAGNSTSNNKSNSATSITLGNANASADVLKQRAARFGVSVSSALSEVEKQEKLEKRKERFGGAKTQITTKNSTDGDAAKAARLERFKTAVK